MAAAALAVAIISLAATIVLGILALRLNRRLVAVEEHRVLAADVVAQARLVEVFVETQNETYNDTRIDLYNRGTHDALEVVLTIHHKSRGALTAKVDRIAGLQEFQDVGVWRSNALEDQPPFEVELAWSDGRTDRQERRMTITHFERK
jgi:uncharacterized membrane protein YhiD involved in acid resistance